MKVTLHLDGSTEVAGSALVMNNEQMVDPLNDRVKEISALTKKRKKTEADHIEIARQEFLGRLYLSEDGGPGLPAWNILRSLQDGATRHKRGKDVLRGVYPLVEDVPLRYQGDEERDPDNLWKLGGFTLRKAVGVQRARTMRTRPIFVEWAVSLLVEVDPIIWDMHDLATCWSDAGKYAGLGEMRPVYGRFAATLETNEGDADAENA